MIKMWHIRVLSMIAPVLLSIQLFGQRIITDKQFNYQLTIPDRMSGKMLCNGDTSEMYYDTLSEVGLIITGRSSKFTDIKSYLDCTKHDLEKELQLLQDDTALRLIDCRKSAYYPDDAVMLHFETSVYPCFNRCMIYFFHYKDKEIQFFFLYNKSHTESLAIINEIMQSLKLL